MQFLSGYKTYAAGIALIVLNVVLFLGFLLESFDQKQAHDAVDQVWAYSQQFQALSQVVLGGGLIFLRQAIAKATH